MFFLNQSAQYIFDKHPIADLKNICVVLPSRRAVFYFKHLLAKCSTIPFLSPEVLAIDDFVMKMSGISQIDSVSLLFDLFEVFKKYDSDVKFERFISWAPTLLRDFDTIDQYLVESPKAIFEYMSEAKAIERWNIESLNTGKASYQTTPNTDKYFKLFENIYHVYKELGSRLKDKGLAYRGMGYKQLALGIKTLLIDKENNQNNYEKFYFIGFNALSTSEEKIIETLIKFKKAEILWDADTYLMSPIYNHKAGALLRKYKYGGKFGKFNWESNNWLTEEKNIRIFSVENATLQTKLGGNLYNQIFEKNPNTSTAIVLADENLLQSVIYSLGEKITDFNITMGISLRSSMLFTLIDAIFELQQNIAEFKTKDGEKIKLPKYSHRHIFKVLNHPFIRRYEQIKYTLDLEGNNTKTIFRKTLHEIVLHNIVYLSEEDMLAFGKNEPLFAVIFSRWNDDPKKALQAFYQLIDELRNVYRETKDPIETEYLYLFFIILNRLEKVLIANKEINLKSFKHFLYELIKQEKVPFTSDTNVSLQIMGMLETRCLDFEHVIILSANEGILPAAKNLNSLIPFDVCLEYQLPVHSDQDAVTSYHFFRLLQRAKEVDIVYVIPSGEGVGGKSKEKSRFILQIEHELQEANKKINISYPKVAFTEQIEIPKIKEISIFKTQEIVENISKLIENEGIHPTLLSNYLQCSVRFYFEKIATISQREEVDENLTSDIFGTWIHNTLEKIDKDFLPYINEEDIDKIIDQLSERLEKAYQEKFVGFEVESGMNYLLKQVAEQLLKDFFLNQKTTQKFPIEILDSEKKMEVCLEEDIFGKRQKFKVIGRIDRIERIANENVLRVIDYKTGKVEEKELQINAQTDLEEVLLDPDKGKLRQLWLYQYLMLKKMYGTKEGLVLGGQHLENYKVFGKIYSLRNVKDKLEVNLKFESDTSVLGFIDRTEAILKNIVTDMLDIEKPFSQTTDDKLCAWCDFKDICGR